MALINQYLFLMVRKDSLFSINKVLKCILKGQAIAGSMGERIVPFAIVPISSHDLSWGVYAPVLVNFLFLKEPIENGKQILLFLNRPL